MTKTNVSKDMFFQLWNSVTVDLILGTKMKYEVYILSFSIVGLSIFGQVVLWFGLSYFTCKFLD